MISQFYPPRIAPASRRAGCLAKYLPEFGWRPLVLRQQWDPDRYACDPEYVPGIPDQVRVETVPVPCKPLWTRGYFIELFRRGFLPHTVPGSFLKGGKKALEQIFRRFPVDVIWASCPPACCHVLAHWASHRWRVPWVADCRDIANQYFHGILASTVVPLRIFHEKRLLESASKIVTVSRGLADIIEKRTGRPYRIIPNGFDPADLASSGSTPIGKFNIVYTGDAVLGSPDFRPLLDGIKEFIDHGAIPPEHILVEFYGDRNEGRLKKLFRGHPCEYLVRIKGSVPWRECREIQRSAAILLLQAFPGKRGIYPAKIFEYLAARRPILAVPADGDCIEALLRKTGAGFSCGSAGEVASRLAEWYREWRKTGTVVCRGRLDRIEKYSRREQAGQLAALMDGMTQKCNPGIRKEA